MQTPTNSPATPPPGTPASKSSAPPLPKQSAKKAAPPAPDNRPVKLRMTILERDHGKLTQIIARQNADIAALKKELRAQSSYLHVRAEALRRIFRFLGAKDPSNEEQQEVLERFLFESPLSAREEPLPPSPTSGEGQASSTPVLTTIPAPIRLDHEESLEPLPSDVQHLEL